ncbi:MAG: MerR family transcriptional regulator [Clostridium sp.]|nr:MerR family transcriptional regulator [Clostridium sp.]
MKTYTIKEVSEMFNFPASTLRYYEETGILPDVKRTSSGQRIYTYEHLCRLGAICCFKRTGMSISQLKDFFKYEENESEHIDDMLSLLNNQKTCVENQIKQLKEDYEHLKHKLNYYGDIKKSLQTGSPHPDWNDYK